MVFGAAELVVVQAIVAVEVVANEITPLERLRPCQLLVSPSRLAKRRLTLKLSRLLHMQSCSMFLSAFVQWTLLAAPSQQ